MSNNHNQGYEDQIASHRRQWDARRTITQKIQVLEQAIAFTKKNALKILAVQYERCRYGRNAAIGQHLLKRNIFQYHPGFEEEEGENGRFQLRCGGLDHAEVIIKHIKSMRPAMYFSSMEEMVAFRETPHCLVPDPATGKLCGEQVFGPSIEYLVNATLPGVNDLLCFHHRLSIIYLLRVALFAVEAAVRTIATARMYFDSFEEVCRTIRAARWHPHGPSCEFGEECNNSNYGHWRKAMDSVLFADWAMNGRREVWTLLGDTNALWRLYHRQLCGEPFDFATEEAGPPPDYSELEANPPPDYSEFETERDGEHTRAMEVEMTTAAEDSNHDPPPSYESLFGEDIDMSLE